MSRIIIATLALLILSMAPLLASSEAANNLQLAKDKQIAVDLQYLNIERLLMSSNGTLVIVKLSPIPTASRATNSFQNTDVIDPKTGAVSHVITLKGLDVSGRYIVFDAYTQQAAKNVTGDQYQWSAPAIMAYDAYALNKNRFLPWSEHDNRFILGGTVVCRLNTAATGSDKFSEDILIPGTWRQYVPGALNFHKTHPGLFAPGDMKKNQAALAALLDNPNPFLAIEAERCLAENFPFDPAFVPLHVAKADAYKQAAFTLLLLDNAAEQTRPALMSELGEVISSAPNTAAIKGIALAVFLVNDKVLLTQVNQKLNALNTHTEADSYIVRILTLAKVRK